MNQNQNQKLTAVKNEINQMYGCTSTHYVVCVDITLVGAYGQLFIAMDLASRCIIAHCHDVTPITSDRLIKCLKSCFESRGQFLPPITILHSDRGSIFKSRVFEEFLLSSGITQSLGSSRAHQNQAIERLNRTIKERIKTKLSSDWRQTKQDPLEELSVTSGEFRVLAKEAIEEYNSSPHRTLRGFSPNQMEEALFERWGGSQPEPDEVVLYNSKDPAFIAHLDQVQTEYRRNWEEFFLEWRVNSEANSEKRHQEVISSIKDQSRGFEEQRRELQNDYETLFEQNLKIQKELAIVRAEAAQSKLERTHKSNRNKQPIRDTINKWELSKVLNLVKGQTALQRRRRKLALVLLYFTGLGVADILGLTVSQVSELLESGNTRIALISGDGAGFPLVIKANDRTFMAKKFQDEFDALRSDRPGNSLFFCNKHGEQLSREYFDRELNEVLSKASGLLNKHLRTYSFRAGHIADFLIKNQVSTAQEPAGHQSSASTIDYRRTRVSLKARRSRVNKRPKPKGLPQKSI